MKVAARPKLTLVLWATLLVVTARASATIYFVHPNHLGTPLAITSQAGAVVWRADSDPFGKANVTLSTVTMNLRLPGQYFDAETGVHYNYFRDYDPVSGRYLQSDPIGLEGGINIYAYVYNNPFRWTDRLGLDAAVSLSPHVLAGLGHVGINPNNASTVGQRPQSGDIGDQIMAGLLRDTPGEISPDPIENIGSVAWIPLTPADDLRLSKCIARHRDQGANYNARSNSCVDFVRDCLREVGVPLSDTNFPRELFNEIIHLPGVTAQRFKRR